MIASNTFEKLVFLASVIRFLGVTLGFSRTFNFTDSNVLFAKISNTSSSEFGCLATSSSTKEVLEVSANCFNSSFVEFSLIYLYSKSSLEAEISASFSFTSQFVIALVISLANFSSGVGSPQLVNNTLVKAIVVIIAIFFLFLIK
jgi:hypothetical protein